ncbi:hypothetical protein GCM10008938_37610 [Deinococcus roseus]|uniref:Uncharacterized protein n=1 Tax=Deinococcus roseus TaxID=392414 RepID=A0ABQ2DAV1_9DEIO|nr:hypothetical protein GCM10008938_37610 [Deinococcus roseus]
MGQASPWGTPEQYTLTVLEDANIQIQLFGPSIDTQSTTEADRHFDHQPALTTFKLTDSRGHIVAMRYFGLGKSMPVTFLNARLSKGQYQFSTETQGAAVNHFQLTLQGPSTLGSFNRQNTAVPGSWTEVYQFTLNEVREGATLKIYDGDGPAEVMLKLVDPLGNTYDLTAPDNLQWLEYPLPELLGHYRVYAKVPQKAVQASNTLAFQLGLSGAGAPRFGQLHLEAYVKTPYNLIPITASANLHGSNVLVASGSGSNVKAAGIIRVEPINMIGLQAEPLQVSVPAGGEATAIINYRPQLEHQLLASVKQVHPGEEFYLYLTTHTAYPGRLRMIALLDEVQGAEVLSNPEGVGEVQSGFHQHRIKLRATGGPVTLQGSWLPWGATATLNIPAAP